ncbi:MAG TPA: serine protease [Candidatus Binatia bacterium]|nr:serine protease [Candidatus Binatia bacterium]
MTSAELRGLADSVAALVEHGKLRRTSDGRFRLATTSYQEEYDLCAGETFAAQPLGCFCTGFLVAPDVIATAGHCVRSTKAARRTWFVFGFRMLNRDRARTEFHAADVYRGAALLGREEADSGPDWALVRLDRPVVGRAPLRVRDAGKISDDRRVFVIGHPSGLPSKLAGGARVRENRRRAFFVANLDTYGGNSGSPVFDQRTKVVEGILVRGEQDFVAKGDCYVSTVCPDAGCQGESVTRSTWWAGRIPAAG